MIVPFYDKAVVEPIIEENIIKNPSGTGFKYAGKVVAIGRDVQFLKVGDTVFFMPHARWETSDIEGKKYHLITEDSEFILGKVEA